MKIVNHWLSQAIKLPSPNFDDRICEEDLSLIVVHCISLPPGQFGGDYIDQLFCNQLNPEEHVYFKEIQHFQVSAHLLIKRCGTIVQYVAFNKRAWHAGLSEYKGREKCNDFSIGIELEGTETNEYSDQQYRQLSSIIKILLLEYPGLATQNIVGHSDISPGRKADPGEFFYWEKLFSNMK